MRLALGAGQWRLLRSLGAEFLILGVLSGGGGLLASVVILTSLRPALTSHFGDVLWQQDSTTIALALAAGVGACALCGLVPTLRLVTQDPLSALRMTGPTHTRTGVGRSVALSLQVAACCVLLVGALLFIRSVHRGLSVDLGYAGRQLLITWVDVSWRKYNRAEGARLKIRSRAA